MPPHNIIEGVSYVCVSNFLCLFLKNQKSPPFIDSHSANGN